MARQHGYNSKTRLKRETTWGTAPAGNYVDMRFDSNTLGGARALMDDPEAGRGRDPERIFQDVVNVDGDIRVPMDMRYIGYWLTAIFGDPTTSGSSIYTHTFKSGAASLPSYAIEVGHPQAAAFYMNDGVMANSLSLDLQRAGPAFANISLIGRKETKNASTQAGSPTSQTFARTSNFQGTLKQGGNVIANVNSGTMVYSNNLVPVEVLSADSSLLGGIDPGQASLTGTLNTRFADPTLLANALSATPIDLEFAWTIDTNNKLIFTLPEVYLEKSKPEINGPGGIAVSVNYKGVKNTVAGYMLQAVLTNDLAGSTYTS